MQSLFESRVSFLSLAAAFAIAACSSDQHPSGGSDAGKTHPAEAGAGGAPSTDGGSADCDVTVAPSSNDLQTIKDAIENKLKTGQTLCFSPGTYKLTDHVTLASSAQVTFRGTGSSRDDVVLDFTGQTNGDEGILVSTEGFTIENLSIKNTQGNGIKVQADNSVFRNIKVGWDNTTPGDAGPTTGGYAIYPTGCNVTLMENNEVYGAADAGIYAGQCKHVIARNNDAHDNVLGIEVENTLGAEVYDNEVHGNTTGILLDLLPNLQQKTAEDYYVHDNHVYENNRRNDGQPNTLAATAPLGTGILVLASHDIEIAKNDIAGNSGVAVLIVSYDIIDLLAVANGGTASTPDPTTSRWPRRIYVHDNVFSGNGGDPVGSYAVFGVASDGGQKTNPYDVAWDGILDPNGYGDAGPATAADAQICLGATEQKSFVDFQGQSAASLFDPSKWSTDTKPHQCTLPPISPLTP
ncbi:MAG TPA: parallel beta-helix domain-containing protein [Polyangiaceae bacterium]|nr:parallel beta-helix domain-containing protein [Polyangiaceae bacterium]